ncbi:hypothetical protein Plav_2629 [Parvibaculum lavamentivorans DS-1]|uniref:Uncharacterized protein n=1 Tax=Parvibaculum lavamentivorans (strain DS-1 / DSM 13023 / NCIMB 13966) TaxID=402881 RepID=A7HWF4_PARL1|nr:hypothetical protein [Parvibaculum lavamentivorans]ABS64237.1 hypothetical protein Plav_2629 [Parvibaculum lavamentivorans DS-1]
MARGDRNRRGSGDELVRERPAWIIPVLVFIGVLTFSGVFLYYYFGPTPAELLGLDPRASTRSSRVEAIVGDTRFLIPEHYTRYPSQRGGGRQMRVDMQALLPDMTPYQTGLQEEFGDHSAESDVVFFSLSETSTPLNATRRLKDIYSKYLESSEPRPGPAGLQLFTFRSDSGYANQDLLVGKDKEARMVLIVCDRTGALVDSPNCSRSLLLGSELELVYRYKRDHLSDWYEIDEALTSLVASFETVEPTDDLQGTILD